MKAIQTAVTFNSPSVSIYFIVIMILTNCCLKKKISDFSIQKA